MKHVWPDGAERPGYGRGVLAGDSVLWPTRDKLYVFDQQTAQPRKVVDLAARGASGGNLLVADGRLLIATEQRIDRAWARTAETMQPIGKRDCDNAN